MKPRIETSSLANGLPADSQWLFPEYEFASMSPKRFAPVIMERVLERGSAAQIRWLLGCYGQKVVAAWVRQYGYRRLSRKVFEYWRWVFGIKRFHRPLWDGMSQQRLYRP